MKNLNRKKPLLKQGFKLADCISTIHIGDIAENTMKMVDTAFSIMVKHFTPEIKPNPALAAQGKYGPKQHVGHAWCWQPKKTNQD